MIRYHVMYYKGVMFCVGSVDFHGIESWRILSVGALTYVC